MNAKHRPLERGTALVAATVFGTLLTLGALVVMSYGQAIGDRETGQGRVERASTIGEAGISYFAEQWRKDSTYFDINGGGAVAMASTANAQIGVVHACGGGSFTLTRLESYSIGGGSATGKIVTVRGAFGTRKLANGSIVDDVTYTWRALLGPNLLSPIQGVGTTGNQTWYTGSELSSISGGKPTAFGNGKATIQKGATINGDVSMHSGVSNSGTITGAKNTKAATITFPDKTKEIADQVSAAKGRAASYWSDPKTSLVFSTAPTEAEKLNANPSNYGSGWLSQANMKSEDLVIRGGVASLPAGNYAFGRLWLDGTILTIKAPAGGGTLILPDLYLTNGARLIIDATEGSFVTINPVNNAFETSSDVGYEASSKTTSKGAEYYDTATSSWKAATGGIGTRPLQMTFDAGGNDTKTTDRWYQTGGASSSAANGPKPDRGSSSGYDDWQIKDDAALITVTKAASAKGMEMYMGSEGDIVLANGARIMPGVPAVNGLDGTDNLAKLQKSSEPLSGYAENPSGFITWSGGGSVPRFNINAQPNGDAGSGDAPSYFNGLTYGGFEGTIGANGHFTGAFVGTTLDNYGSITYDGSLASLLVSPDPNSNHAVVKFRPQDAN